MARIQKASWVAYFLYALASPGGLATAHCPLLMLYFLFRVTGIPMTEAQALKSRGEAYREYQRRTSGCGWGSLTLGWPRSLY